MRNSTLYDSCLAPADTSDHNSIMFKLSFLLGEIACSALTFLLNFGIIWYENVVSENRRTLINKMISLTSLYTMMHVLTTGLVANAVFVFDYRTVWFCDVVNNVSMTLFLVLALGYNETMILRYVYACKLETVGVLNEAFFRHLLVVLNFFLNFFDFVILMMMKMLQMRMVKYGMSSIKISLDQNTYNEM